MLTQVQDVFLGPTSKVFSVWMPQHFSPVLPSSKQSLRWRQRIKARTQREVIDAFSFLIIQKRFFSFKYFSAINQVVEQFTVTATPFLFSAILEFK